MSEKKYIQNLIDELYAELKQEEDKYTHAIQSGEKYQALRIIRMKISELKTQIKKLMDNNK